MKNIVTTLVIIFTLIFVVSCDKDFENINQPNEGQVLSTKQGLLSLTVGMSEHFATHSLSPIVEVSGLSTREFGNLLTYLTPAELVLGGTQLNNDNTGIARLWNRLLRDKGMAESILDNVDKVKMAPETKSGLKAYAKWFKAMTLGYLIQNFEQVPIDNSSDGNSKFSSREEVLKVCVELLKSAQKDLKNHPASSEFKSKIPTIDLESVINAFLARYLLFSGNYEEAILVANQVDLTQKSEWIYDGTTAKNPIWNIAFFESKLDTKPQDNFGLIGQYIPDVNDGRIAFYLSPSDDMETDFGKHKVDNAKGFFDMPEKSIPVYLPGEMLLIQAEAYAMKGDLVNAVKYIDKVRQKNNDIYGVNADLPAWSGDKNNKTAVLNEIYKNRCIELFMTGMRLEDSRRLHPNLDIPKEGSYTNERNRNYYPYPFKERENNKNTPTDPSI